VRNAIRRVGPRGKKDLDISFQTPDHATDRPVYYFLFSPDDLEPTVTESGAIDVTATDATPPRTIRPVVPPLAPPTRSPGGGRST
jgi:hypothetical protein